MWTWLLAFVGSLVAALVVIMVINEISSRKRAAFYAEQGFSPEITTGLPGLSRLIIKGLSMDNVLEPLYHRVEKAQKEGFPGIIYNVPQNGTALVQLIDPSLIREFASKENDVACRLMPTDLKVKTGFNTMAGDAALAQRAIFSEFFRMDYLNKLIPRFNSILDESFKAVERTSDGKLNIKDSKLFIDQFMIKVITSLIFGEGAEIPRADNGLSFSDELVNILQCVFSKDIFYHPVNILSRNWANYLNILPSARRAYQRARHMDKLLAEYINERANNSEKYKEERKKFCLINLMLDYNEKAPELQKISMENMIGNCNVFLVAGYDTTATSMSAMLYCLSKNPGLLAQVREATKSVNRPDVNFDEIDQVDLLDRLVRESIRFNPAGGNLIFRKLSSDFSVGKYKFRKGDHITVPIAPMMWLSDYFPSERAFDIGALNDQNKKYYIPFYLGKRNCVGQQLAQMEMKLLAIYIANRFSLKALSDRPKYGISFTMQIHDCQVEFSDLS